jgi:hypothetical protein
VRGQGRGFSRSSWPGSIAAGGPARGFLRIRILFPALVAGPRNSLFGPWPIACTGGVSLGFEPDLTIEECPRPVPAIEAGYRPLSHPSVAIR